MIWTPEEPKYGCMIRIKINSIYHYGIYVSHNEIIQFGFAPMINSIFRESDIKVCTSDIDTFSQGKPIEVAIFTKEEEKKNRTPDKVIEYARSKIGMDGYNILHNNCEHFAYECITGRHYSSLITDAYDIMRYVNA
jgi:hypothetical protein